MSTFILNNEYQNIIDIYCAKYNIRNYDNISKLAKNINKLAKNPSPPNLNVIQQYINKTHFMLSIHNLKNSY